MSARYGTMNWSFTLLSGFLLAAVVLNAGCTQADNTAVVPVTPVPPAVLAAGGLTPNEVPAGFTKTTDREKRTDEVGDLARDLGWESGHIVEYSGITGNSTKPTVITQTMTVYRSKEMGKIARIIETNDQNQHGLGIQSLSPPNLGENSRAFSGKAGMLIDPRQDAQSPLATGSATAAYREDMVEIIFTKGPVLEVITMTGPGSDYPALLEMAVKAYDKIS
ncbi:MAG: hypothetical protein GYA23_08885 [Methanomicrobiales archaeon]|nr:hypothetical protein [Methanomicrobiales archaeon]